VFVFVYALIWMCTCSSVDLYFVLHVDCFDIELGIRICLMV
jgi:hypothetical protein